MTASKDEPKTSIDDFDTAPNEHGSGPPADEATGEAQAEANREQESPS